MASAKVENRGALGSKRSRNDVSVREGDWTCPQCGNVNFSFRNVCNRGACGAPRPSPSPSPRLMPAPIAGRYDRSPMFYGGAGAPPPIPLGSSSYGAPYPPLGMRYGYGPPVGAPGSYGLFSSYGGPPGPMGGMGYGPGPELGRYGYAFRGSPMPGSSPWSGGALAESNDSTASRKRRGGPDGLSEGDWTCPKCDNINFSFRSTCNMKKCGAPRPTPGANTGPSRKDKDAPEGSWTCTECNNLNYPFRTMCNRKGCSSSRPNPANN